MNGPGEGASAAGRTVYYEPAQTYRSAWTLLGAFVLGFVADLALGHGSRHILAWLVAVVLVVGIDVLMTRAARSMRSITVTRTELRVGESAVPRESITAVVDEVDPSLPVFGLSVGHGLPRGIPGLAVSVVDGAVLVVPTRHPDRLAAALQTSHEALSIRPAEPDELDELDEIDTRADSLFRVAGYELPDLDFEREALRDARAIFVAGRPAVAFVWVTEVDGVAHIEELAVIPGRMRQGLGSALVEAACDWAAGAGYPAITLTTFAQVAWNAPFYATRGFAVVEDLTPELTAVRDHERAVGLDAVGARVAMRRELNP
ncbi:MAG: GNAT family N-acetyltransferase [Pseudonocardiales bacterium]